MKKRKTKPEKYTSEQIDRYLQLYLQQKKNLEPVSATGVAKWCNAVLHVEPSLVYTDFTRKPEIKAKIEEYNKRLLNAITNPMDSSSDASMTVEYIDIEEVMKSYSGSDKIRSILQRANINLENLLEENRKLRKSRLEDQKTTETMKVERESLIKNSDQMKQKLQESGKEIKRASEDVARLKKVIAMQQEYIEKHVYEPISINHFMAMGFENDSGLASMPKNYECLIDQEEDSFPLAVDMHTKEEPVDVISVKSASLMDQLRNIGKT